MSENKAEKVVLERLVNADQILEQLFEAESRPTRRTVWNRVRGGHIPHHRTVLAATTTLDT